MSFFISLTFLPCNINENISPKLVLVMILALDGMSSNTFGSSEG